MARVSYNINLLSHLDEAPSTSSGSWLSTWKRRGLNEVPPTCLVKSDFLCSQASQWLKQKPPLPRSFPWWSSEEQSFSPLNSFYFLETRHLSSGFGVFPRLDASWEWWLCLGHLYPVQNLALYPVHSRHSASVSWMSTWMILNGVGEEKKDKQNQRHWLMSPWIKDRENRKTECVLGQVERAGSLDSG